MSDKLQDRGGRDRSRIDVNEEWDLRYRTDRFRVSAEDLKQVVQEVGDRVEDVERRLSKSTTGGR